MNPNAKQILTPTGRLVAGNLYKGSDKDAEGKPRLVKNGPNVGQPSVQFYYALAIAKTPGKMWWDEPWGALIYQAGAAAFPQSVAGFAQAFATNPMAAAMYPFAWKVKDGDSQMPNKKGKRPCDQEGYPGHWILSFTSGFAPKIYNANGTEQITAPDAVKIGYYVQVSGNVVGNDSPNQPGVFLNGTMVALQGYGPEIVSGPDASAVGFGQGPLPAGASAVPLGAMPSSTPAVPGAAVPTPATPAVPGAVPSVPVPAAQAPIPVPVTPNPGFAGMPAVPSVPSVPAVPPARAMSVKAAGATYEQMIAAGWNDQLLTQHGMFA